jgi:hypothetical protein
MNQGSVINMTLLQEAATNKLRQLCLEYGWEYIEAVRFLQEWNQWQADWLAENELCLN